MNGVTAGRDLLQCRCCGAVFPEGKATRDGWTYQCPESDCDGSGLEAGLRRIE